MTESNKIVLITGTTSGIGKALAEEFAQHQYEIIAVARNEEKLQEQRAQWSKNGIVSYGIAQDLTQTGAVDRIIDELNKQQLSVDVLVNNAGLGVGGKLVHQKQKGVDEMILVNNLVLSQLTRALLPDMLERKKGRILNLGSTASFAPCPHAAVYGATKAFVLSFSYALRRELKGSGITVSALCPGGTATEFSRKADLTHTPLFYRMVMSPDRVAKTAYAGLMRGKAIIVPGIYNKFQVYGSRLLPSSVTSAVSEWLLTDKS